MNLGKREVKKLEVIFSAKYDALKCEWQCVIDRAGRNAGGGNWWVDYCDRHNIEIMHPDWVKECFNEKGKIYAFSGNYPICISSPESDFWLLVPKNMAEKVLVLGYLP